MDTESTPCTGQNCKICAFIKIYREESVKESERKKEKNENTIPTENS